MEDRQLEGYLREIWHDTEGSQQRHLTLREAHTIVLTDNAPGTFEWAAPRIAAHLKGQEQILDIGCGGGQYLAFLLSQHDLITLGIGLDRHTRLNDEVRPRLENNRGWGLVQGNALELPFPASSFTAAMANRMLNQTGDIARALAEAARVLKPGGAFFIVTADSARRSTLREIHETAQQNLGFPAYLYHGTTSSGQRLNLENSTTWLSVNFEEINLERYERVMVFRQLPEVLEYYATGLLFHRANDTDSPETSPAHWLKLYRTVEAKLEELLTTQGQIEIRESAALFTARKRA